MEILMMICSVSSTVRFIPLATDWISSGIISASMLSRYSLLVIVLMKLLVGFQPQLFLDNMNGILLLGQFI